MAFLKADQVEIGSFEGAARGARDVTVVIDVFRAFTSAAIALSRGARDIVMTGDLQTARDLRDRGVGRYCIGERGGVRPEGFDFGNSPCEIADFDFSGETVIQTTSNGTRGVLAARDAACVYAGAFVTADATAAAILARRPRSVALVAMGDRARGDEDEMCALYLRSRLLGFAPDRSVISAATLALSHRVASGSVSPRDADACLRIGTTSFAVRVTAAEDLMRATAETPA